MFRNFGLKHQGLIVEVTVTLQLDQGERKKRAVYHFFPDFLVLLDQAKEQKKILSLKNKV